MGAIALVALFPTLAQAGVDSPRAMTKPSSSLLTESAAPLTLAQVVPPIETLPPSQQPQPDPELPPPLPSLDELLRPGQLVPETPLPIPGEIPETVVVNRFEVIGSTVFNEAELAAVTAPYTQRPLTFNELFEVRSQITTLYAEAGYVTSAAIIPPQALTEGVVTIQVIEGVLEDIVVEGTENLKPDYASSRLEPYVTPPLNVDRLLEGLQLLQVDPLVQRVSAELSAGPRPGTSSLTLAIDEAKSGSLTLDVNNFRSPSVGTFQQILELQEDNLTGLGDRFRLAVSNSEGSNSLQLGYRTYLNPQNGTFEVTVGGSLGEVVEGDLEALDIDSRLFFVEATWRQPLRRTPTLEEAIGVTYTRQQSEAFFLGDVLGESVPFPAVGSDDNGVTTVSALRFFYENTRQSDREVLALRSQISLGLGEFLGGTVLDDPNPSLFQDFVEPTPDNQFVAFQGQAQWVRLIEPETLLILRGELQLASDALVPAEQFRLGGAFGVRGYRQDFLLTDNGVLGTAEVRLSLYSNPANQQRLQLAPFVEIGTGWNHEGNSPADNVLASLGAGLIWEQPNLTARIDLGIPLIEVDRIGDTIQENGIYFSLVYRPTF